MIDWIINQLARILAAIEGVEPGKDSVMTTITVEQKVLLDADPKSADGYAAEVEAGSWVWGVREWSPQDVVTLQPENDKCWVIPTGTATGTVEIFSQADADLGPAFGPILGSYTIQVTGAKAAKIDVSAGTPVPKSWQPEPEY